MGSPTIIFWSIMRKIYLAIAITISAQAASLHIIEGPAVERATNGLAIIRWVTENPGGTDLHYAVVHYGTGPEHVSQTSRSPNRRSRTLPNMTFRVRVDGLKPGTTYYYWVESVQATGAPDGVRSPVSQFTTPH
jgi:hypothetical protein